MNALTETELELTPEEEAAAEPPVFQFATIGAVFEDGVTLIFDGEEAATEKHYKVNKAVPFQAGDRVKICADSGTYVAEYAIGFPGGASPGGGSSGNTSGSGGILIITVSDGISSHSPSEIIEAASAGKAVFLVYPYTVPDTYDDGADRVVYITLPLTYYLDPTYAKFSGIYGVSIQSSSSGYLDDIRYIAVSVKKTGKQVVLYEDRSINLV